MRKKKDKRKQDKKITNNEKERKGVKTKAVKADDGDKKGIRN